MYGRCLFRKLFPRLSSLLELVSTGREVRRWGEEYKQPSRGHFLLILLLLPRQNRIAWELHLLFTTRTSTAVSVYWRFSKNFIFKIWMRTRIAERRRNSAVEIANIASWSVGPKKKKVWSRELSSSFSIVIVTSESVRQFRATSSYDLWCFRGPRCLRVFVFGSKQRHHTQILITCSSFREDQTLHS